MAWNDQQNDKDPWRGKGQPPDLDEALKRFLVKFKRVRPTGPKDTGGSNQNPTVFLAFLAGIVLLLWALSGIFIVNAAEQAAILRLGRYVGTVGPGPHWIPRFLESKVVVNVERVADYSYSAQMLTKDENLVSVALVVQYRISDLQDYLFNVSDPEESLQQATSSALRQVVGNTRLDQIITEGREAWGSSVQETLIKILDGYKTGIKIVNVSPQPARAPENVQDAFDDAIKAQEDEKRFKEQARAYEASVVPIAEGNAQRILAESTAYEQQVVLRATGEVAEFLAILPEYVRTPAITSERLYLDAMQQVLSQSSKVIVDAKAGNMMVLPLEKLITAVASKQEATIVANPLPIIKPEADSSLVAGRETVRPTTSVGRND
jgi:membrane protease subunit HflK